MLLANLAVIDDPRARGIYDKLGAAYNSALRPGARPIPPFEEWQGVSSCCDNYYCRWVFLSISTISISNRAVVVVEHLSEKMLYAVVCNH